MKKSKSVLSIIFGIYDGISLIKLRRRQPLAGKIVKNNQIHWFQMKLYTKFCYHFLMY